MHRVLAFLKAQALPLGMLSGVAVYLLFHWLPILNPLKPLADGANTYVLPIMVFVMLFTTFCKVNPAEMKFCRWHGIMLLLQLSVCLFIALILHFFQHIGHKVVVEGALVCLIAPTGTTAAVMIPLVFPLVETRVAGSFLSQFLTILHHIFPLLICPFLAAWGLRVFFPRKYMVGLRAFAGILHSTCGPYR